MPGRNERKWSSKFLEAGTDPLSPVGRPELVFGLVGPVGVDRSKICDCLQQSLEKYGYTVHRIKMSDLISYIKGCENLKKKCRDEYERIDKFMSAGTSIRQQSKLGDALAILGISELSEKRKELNERDQPREPIHHDDLSLFHRTETAYIFDSLKHPHEVSTLRATYGRGFYLISVHSNREFRIENLSKRIASSVFKPQDYSNYRSQSEALINRDEREQGSNQFGQNVQLTFPLADFFINLDLPQKTFQEEISRFLRVVFDYPFSTPSRDESGMFHAEAASWRSSDLSRQVGASICTEEGDIIALGCNEVPKAGGGLYWDGDIPDNRDFKIGHDEGAFQKRFLVAEIINKFQSENIISKSKKTQMDRLVNDVLAGKNHPLLDGLGALNVIEYGRAVHAEMAALTDAAKRGIAVQGCTMYVNTFPCHICARHIIASGIKRLVYIEPYPKSLSNLLYKDSLSMQRPTSRKNVELVPFSGVAPRAYQDSFKSIAKRKNKDGTITSWNKKEATTKLKRFSVSYILIEQQIIRSMLPKLENLKINL